MANRKPLLPGPVEAEILRLLVARRESYGLELVKASDGSLKRGTVYVTLGRMEKDGLVQSRVENATPDYVGIPRRLYRTTGLGETSLRMYDEVSAAFAARGLT